MEGAWDSLFKSICKYLKTTFDDCVELHEHCIIMMTRKDNIMEMVKLILQGKRPVTKKIEPLVVPIENPSMKTSSSMSLLSKPTIILKTLPLRSTSNPTFPSISRSSVVSIITMECLDVIKASIIVESMSTFFTGKPFDFIHGMIQADMFGIVIPRISTISYVSSPISSRRGNTQFAIDRMISLLYASGRSPLSIKTSIVELIKLCIEDSSGVVLLNAVAGVLSGRKVGHYSSYDMMGQIGTPRSNFVEACDLLSMVTINDVSEPNGIQDIMIRLVKKKLSIPEDVLEYPLSRKDPFASMIIYSILRGLDAKDVSMSTFEDQLRICQDEHAAISLCGKLNTCIARLFG